MSTKKLTNYTPVSSIRLDPSIKTRIKRVAQKNRTTFSGMLRILIEEALAARSN